MIDQERLLDLLLYAVNQANGWHDDCHGGGIKSQEMAQCVAVLAASGRHPVDHSGIYAPSAARDLDLSDLLEHLGELNTLAVGRVKSLGSTTIRTGAPGLTWRKICAEVKA